MRITHYTYLRQERDAKFSILMIKVLAEAALQIVKFSLVLVKLSRYGFLRLQQSG